MTKLEAICLKIAGSSNEPISALRMSLMVYLCDWKSAVFFKKKITNKEYQYHSHSVKNDIMDYIKNSMYFKFKYEKVGGSIEKVLILPINKNLDTDLTIEECSIVESILKDFSELYFDDLLYYVSKTKPLSESEIYTKLDLEKTAINSQFK